MLNTYLFKISNNSAWLISQLYQIILAKIFTRLFLPCLFLSSIWPSLALANQLPSIDSGKTNLISPEQEAAIGRIVTAEINRLPYSAELVSRLWLNDLIQPLINHSDLANKQLQVFIVQDSTINAFAAPGGVIGVNTGLLLNSQYVDELVAVMSHEIAHLSQRHYAHRRANDERNAPLYIGAILASLVAASKIDGNAGTAGIYATITAITNQQMVFSRSHEQEADRIGMKLMQDTDFDVRKMLSMLKQLDSPYIKQDPKWQWTRSHPISAQRIADLTLRIVQTEASETSPSYQQSFDLLRIMLFINSVDITTTSMPDLLAKGTALALDKHDLYRQFTKAMIYMRQHRWHTAETILAQLSALYPTEAFFWDQWMRSLSHQGKTQRLVEIASEHLQTGIQPLLTHYHLAKGYAGLQQWQPALRNMNKVLDTYPQWIGGWELAAEWAGFATQLAKHHIAKGYWHFLRGETKVAIIQTKLAQQVGQLTRADTQLLARLKSQLKS